MVHLQPDVCLVLRANHFCQVISLFLAFWPSLLETSRDQVDNVNEPSMGLLLHLPLETFFLWRHELAQSVLTDWGKVDPYVVHWG